MRSYLIILVLLLCGSFSGAQNKKEIEPYKLNMAYAESLSKKADFYYRSNNFDEAIKIIEEKLNIIEELTGKDNIEYAIGQVELAVYFANNGNHERAIELSLDALSKIEIKDSNKSHMYAFVADKLAIYYYIREDYKSSLIYMQKALTIYKELYGTDNENYISSKMNLANIYSKLSKVDDALSIQIEILDYWKNKGDSLKYAQTLHDISLTYGAIGNYSKAIELCNESNAIIEKELGENDMFYIESLKTLADFYIEHGDYEKAIEKSEKQLCLYEKYYGYKSIEFVTALSNQAFYYVKSGNYKKAIENETKALSIQLEYGIVDSLAYAKNLLGLATYNRELGFIDLALDFGERSIRILQNFPQTIAYRSALSNMSSCYLLLGKYDKALELSERVLGLLHNNKESSEYYGWLSNLANCYYVMGSYDDAIQIYEEVLENQCRLLGEKNIDYASTLENLAHCYRGKEDLQTALKYQRKCIEIQKGTIGVDNIKYALSVLNFGYLLRCAGEDIQSLKYQEEALMMLKKDTANNIRYADALEQIFWGYIFLEPQRALDIAKTENTILNRNNKQITKNHIRSLRHLLYAYIELGNYREAHNIIDSEFDSPEVLAFFEKDIKELVDFRNLKSQLYTAEKKYEEAIAIEKEAISMCKRNGCSFSEYESILNNLLLNYYYLGDYNEAGQLLKDEHVFENLRNEVYFNINSLSSKYRYSYWNKFKDIFSVTLPSISLATNDSALISQTYDNSALFAKGILLRENIYIANAVQKSTDSNLKNIFKHYQNNLAILNKGDIDLIESDSLSEIIMNQEDEIIQRIKLENQDVTLFPSWKDIQKCLKEDEIAVEFLSVKIEGKYKEGYIALTLKKDYRNPHMIPLCSRIEIDSVLSGNGKNHDLFELIWKPITDELKNVNRIFFSPSGILHNIGLEYLADDENFLFNKYDIYRLSSTQELLKSIPAKKHECVVLYGGLDYNCHPNSMNKIQNRKGDSLNEIRGQFRDLILSRGNFDPLYGSGLEIKEIARIVKDKNIDCKLFEGSDGTEESFKSLNNSIDILHIATHGIYLCAEEKERVLERNFNFVLPENKEHLLTEDVALTRSFLVMSGGDMLPSRYDVPKGTEDGILTAQEISRLNLSGLDLVVLSSCQSGLGDISYDGVLGLQRGFKKAGANTIIMSLDKVDDDATRILMVEFYKNLMSGKSKHQSLKNAQKYLREVENDKYDDPKYWASFIMLDGIN
jgi:CHAT domain-containing protein/lipopolysaccharide biosynthesis regulator YciM